ncbi:hypothetical protein BD560DRAFT_13632 [Blakeslea trispora]|nr:hypothetical protein BD560DRAFT_13632 [Blakeslea trispora]
MKLSQNHSASIQISSSFSIMLKHYLPTLSSYKQPTFSDKRKSTVGKECILFPAYAFRNPKVPSEWIIQSRGWAVSFEKELDLKQKILKFLARFISGKLDTDGIANQLFDRRFKYFLAKGNKDRQIKLQVTDEKGKLIHPYSLRSSDNGLFSAQLHLPDCQWKPLTKLRLHEASYRTQDRRRPFGAYDGWINLVEPYGLSVISDIDDTIKQTHVTSGARTVMSSTFFNPSQCVPGMADKYRQWYQLGAAFHYVSNSPIQLTRMLLYFLQEHQFPPGSLHLKEFQHILSELIESPGQTKMDSIRAIMKDFPHRQFILIGDSGEADIDVYTKIATEYPEQVVKIFIRHVPAEPTEDQPVHEQIVLSDSSKHGVQDEQVTHDSDDPKDKQDEQQESVKPTTHLAGLVMKSAMAESILPQLNSTDDELTALNERIAEAQKLLPNIDIVLFENADELVVSLK